MEAVHPRATEIGLGCFFSRLYQGTDEVYQRPYTFVQIGGASRPVVHLDIDIIMVIYMPWAIYPVGPHSLQVGREIAGGVNWQLTKYRPN